MVGKKGRASTKRDEPETGLTPYQGKKKCFGEYECPECGRTWMSGDSWANTGQECKTCFITVYPHKQRPLEAPEGFRKKSRANTKRNKTRYGLTPYQGDDRCFGEYECPNCERTWMSGNSWADLGQQCKKCLINVYPYDQRQLVGQEGSDNRKPHPQELCEKCQIMGRPCNR